MEEYEKHIIDNKSSIEAGKEISYCGTELFMQWTFLDIDHAIGTVRDGGRLTPCKKCCENIINLLK